MKAKYASAQAPSSDHKPCAPSEANHSRTSPNELTESVSTGKLNRAKTVMPIPTIHGQSRRVGTMPSKAGSETKGLRYEALHDGCLIGPFSDMGERLTRGAGTRTAEWR